jgi:1-acyl-sn-glycerol-3-phosphate acyltransferase
VEDWKIKPARDLALPNHQRLRSVERENSLLDSALHLLWWPLVWSYLRLAHRLEVCGRDHLPSEPPFILVANHCSHLDALVLAAFLPVRLRDHVFPIAAGDLFFETPIRAVLATSVLNALPMWRRKCGPGSLLVLRQRLVEDPCGYILFPEGTRSRDGTMNTFKPGLGCLVAETPVPVVPCHLKGTFHCLPPHYVFPRFRKIVLTIGEPLDFSGVSNDRPGWEHIARTTEAAIRRLGEKGNNSQEGEEKVCNSF